MLSKEDSFVIQAQLRRGVYQKDIASELGVDPRTIRRALRRGGAPRARGRRRSKLDPFNPLVDRLLGENVWNGVVILRELQARAYSGGITILRDYIRPKRVLRKSRGTVRFETPPGRQMQSDWGELFGDHVLATAILDRLLHHATTINIKGESYRLKEKRRAGVLPASIAGEGGKEATEEPLKAAS